MNSFLMKKLLLKSNQLSNINNNLILNQETIKPDCNKSISEKSDLNNSFLQNKNNITVDYPKNYPQSGPAGRFPPRPPGSD